MQRLIIYCSFLLLVSCNSKEDAQQGDNFVLTNRKVHTDKLNMFGLPDTTYTKSYNYDNNLNVKDSSEMFAVSKYDDDRRLILRSFFSVSKDSSPLLMTQSRYIYSGKYLATAIDAASGIDIKGEKFVYDTSGKPLKSSIIRIKNFDEIFRRGGNEMLPKDSLINQGYDTLHITYKYDAGNKNIGGDYVTNSGQLIRRDVNIYSGNVPLSSYNLGPKGDTLQRISYVQAGTILTSRIDNNDFTIVTTTNSGFVTGKLTINKKKNEKLKQEWAYESGRVTEERFYVAKATNPETK